MFSLLVHSFKHHCFPSWTFELWLSRLKKNLLTMSDYQHIANRLWSVLCLLISSLSLSSLDISSGKRDISQYCYTYQYIKYVLVNIKCGLPVIIINRYCDLIKFMTSFLFICSFQIMTLFNNIVMQVNKFLKTFIKCRDGSKNISKKTKVGMAVWTSLHSSHKLMNVFRNFYLLLYDINIVE